jgi:hypothetical protein
MQRRDEGFEFLFLDVLKLVNEDRQGGAVGCGRLSGNFQQCLKVVLEVAVVRQAGFCVEVEAHFDILILHLERLGEARQALQCALGEILRSCASGKPQQRLAELRRARSIAMRMVSLRVYQVMLN